MLCFRSFNEATPVWGYVYLNNNNNNMILKGGLMQSSIQTYTYTTNKNGKIVVTQGNSRTSVSFFDKDGNMALSDINIISWSTKDYMFTCVEGTTGKVYAMPYNQSIRPVISW